MQGLGAHSVAALASAAVNSAQIETMKKKIAARRTRSKSIVQYPF
jgi:hypothetical protein